MNLILFDLDGTLYSSRSILPTAYAEGIDRFNQEQDRSVPVPPDEEIFDQVGNPVDEIYENLFPDLTDGERPRLQQSIFSALLCRIRRGEGRLFEGVESVLETLGDRRPLGVVTNAQTEYMNSVLETHDLDRHFESTLCNDDAPNGEKSEIVEMQLRKFDVSPRDALLVGDRESDRDAAEEHGVHFIGCTFGYGRESLFEGEPTVGAFTELPDRIRTLTT